MEVIIPLMSSNLGRRFDPQCFDEMLYSHVLSSIFAFWEHYETFRLILFEANSRVYT